MLKKRITDMPTPSPQIIQGLNTFAPAFTKPTFANALLLVYGTLLVVGTRTVTATLRAVGLAHHPNFTANPLEIGGL